MTHDDTLRRAVELLRTMADMGPRITKTPDANESWRSLADALDTMREELARQVPVQHPDDEAVDRFAAAMKDKLAKARDAGRSGWQDPAWPADQIRDALYKHIAKGDPRDVANYCMFLWARDASTAPQQKEKS